MTITIYHDDDHARVICGKMADLSHYAEYDENESEKRTSCYFHHASDDYECTWWEDWTVALEGVTLV